MNWHMEYAMGYRAETGHWIPINHDTHPWEYVIREKLAAHAGDPDWEGVEVICRPIVPWAAVAAMGIQKDEA